MERIVTDGGPVARADEIAVSNVIPFRRKSQPEAGLLGGRARRDFAAEGVEAAEAFLLDFCDEERLALILHLLQGEKTVDELGQLLRVSRPAVGSQLARLRRDRIVSVRLQRGSVVYALDDVQVSRFAGLLSRMF